MFLFDPLQESMSGPAHLGGPQRRSKLDSPPLGKRLALVIPCLTSSSGRSVRVGDQQVEEFDEELEFMWVLLDDEQDE